MTNRSLWYGMSVSETLSEIKSNPSGLTAEEAAARLELFGPNELTEKKHKTIAGMIVDQFSDFMMFIVSDSTQFFVSLFLEFFCPHAPLLERRRVSLLLKLARPNVPPRARTISKVWQIREGVGFIGQGIPFASLYDF